MLSVEWKSLSTDCLPAEATNTRTAGGRGRKAPPKKTAIEDDPFETASEDQGSNTDSGMSALTGMTGDEDENELSTEDDGLGGDGDGGDERLAGILEAEVS